MVDEQWQEADGKYKRWYEEKYCIEIGHRCLRVVEILQNTRHTECEPFAALAWFLHRSFYCKNNLFVAGYNNNNDLVLLLAAVAVVGFGNIKVGDFVLIFCWLQLLALVIIKLASLYCWWLQLLSLVLAVLKFAIVFIAGYFLHIKFKLYSHCWFIV